MKRWKEESAGKAERSEGARARGKEVVKRVARGRAELGSLTFDNFTVRHLPSRRGLEHPFLSPSVRPSTDVSLTPASRSLAALTSELSFHSRAFSARTADYPLYPLLTSAFSLPIALFSALPSFLRFPSFFFHYSVRLSSGRTERDRLSRNSGRDLASAAHGKTRYSSFRCWWASGSKGEKNSSRPTESFSSHVHRCMIILRCAAFFFHLYSFFFLLYSLLTSIFYLPRPVTLALPRFFLFKHPLPPDIYNSSGTRSERVTGAVEESGCAVGALGSGCGRSIRTRTRTRQR